MDEGRAVDRELGVQSSLGLKQTQKGRLNPHADCTVASRTSEAQHRGSVNHPAEQLCPGISDLGIGSHL